MTSRRKRTLAKAPRRKPEEEAPGQNGNVDDRLLERITDVILRVAPDRSGQVRLPTERALAEMLGVQRATVRERLATLQSLGVIRRTQGSGTYLSLVSGALSRDVESHRAILAAVGDREPDAARTASDEHFRLWRREAAKVSMLYLG